MIYIIEDQALLRNKEEKKERNGKRGGTAIRKNKKKGKGKDRNKEEYKERKGKGERELPE